MEGITAQDTHIAGYVHDAAKGIVVVINKWDLVKERRRVAETMADPETSGRFCPEAADLPRTSRSS